MSEMLERVADAIAAVQLFSRFNDWASDHVPGLPIEICRHGADDEPEIIVLKRFPASIGEDQALANMLAGARAKAAIEAMREPTAAMDLAGVEAESYRSLGLLKSRHIWKSMIDAAIKDPVTS